MARKVDPKEIRDLFSYAVDSWSDVRFQAREDMRYIAGDPWDPLEREARKKAKRPCLNFDELSQYVNQRINDIRMNKRAVKVTPKGFGANDKKAELRGEIIRAIEGRGGMAAYVTAYENALQRGYGYFGIGKRFINWNSFEQELYLRRIPNPDTVWIDPDFREADASDMTYAFIAEDWTREKFKRRFPKAKVQDFSSEQMNDHPQWVKERNVQVGEFWKVHLIKTKLYLIGDPSQPIVVTADEVKVDGNQVVVNGAAFPILNDRDTEKREVCQYITNGLEVLDYTEWEGKWIPLVPVFGKEVWVDGGGGARRLLVSLVRNVRDAVMLYNYARSCEAEILGQVPKTPYVGYEGQFENHEEEWENVNKVPTAYLQVKPIVDAATGAILPLPRRETQEPPIQAFELASESMKRAIQNGLGMYNASVGRQDTAAKSGKAIQALDVQSDQGNFHFTDNFDRAIEHGGRIMDDMMRYVYDTRRDVPVRKPDDSYSSARINDPEARQPDNDTTQGEYEVSISTGPSYQDQREEVSAFMDALAQSSPQIFARIGDLIVKLKNLGPVGDEMAKRLTPPEFAEKDDPKQTAVKLQQAMQMIDTMTKQLKALAEEKQAKTLELQSKEKIAQAEIESKERIAAIEAQVEETKIVAEAQLERVKLDSQAQMENAKLRSQEGIAGLKAELEALKVEIAALRTPQQQAQPTA